MNKPKPQHIPSVVANVVGLPVSTAPGGLAAYLTGTDLDDPKDLLTIIWLVVGDLNRAFRAADEKLSHDQRILPGAGRYPRYDDGSGERQDGRMSEDIEGAGPADRGLKFRRG